MASAPKEKKEKHEEKKEKQRTSADNEAQSVPRLLARSSSMSLTPKVKLWVKIQGMETCALTPFCWVGLEPLPHGKIVELRSLK